MKGLHLWITLVAALPSLTGCNETENIETDGAPLSFSTSVEEAQTRADDLGITTRNLGTMEVFAFLTRGGGFNAASSTPNFMYKQEMDRQMGSSNWTYSPTKYWPVNSSDKVSFFAYAPNAQGVTPSSQDKPGYPEFDYKVPPLEANQRDLLLSDPIMDKNGGTVPFIFKHTLTLVKFIIKNGDGDGTTKTVSNFTVKAKASAKLAYKSSGGFAWSGITGTQTFTPRESSVTVAGTKDATATLATFYLLPDNAGASFSMKYTMQGTVEAGGTAPTHEVTVTDKAIGSTPAWEVGKAIFYTITLSKTGLQVEAAGDTWEEGSSNEMQVFTESELKPGDYYYSDGTWSDGGLRGLNKTTGEAVMANPVPGPETGSKTPIGVVFHAGRHTTDDSTYPAGMGTVKGYVVSSDDCGNMMTSPLSWVNKTSDSTYKYLTGASTSTDDYKGYFNTQQIKATAESKTHWSSANFPLPYTVVESHTPSAPASISSGWYMPSLGQLKDLSKYRELLNINLGKISSSMVGDDEGMYWSSTEVDANNAYTILFGGITSSVSTDKKKVHATRPVLTF